MANALIEEVTAALAEFSGATRLIDLKVGERNEYRLLVEAFAAEEAVQEVGLRDVIALSTSAHIPVPALLGQPATLELGLGIGTRARFSGEICAAAMLGSDESKDEKVVVRWLVCSLDDDTNLSIEHDLRLYFRGDVNVLEPDAERSDRSYEYGSRGNFFISEDRGTSEELIPQDKLLGLLSACDAIPCRVMMTVYLKDPYYSSIMKIPTADIIGAIKS